MHYVVADLHLDHFNVVLYEPVRAQKLAELMDISVEEVHRRIIDKDVDLLRVHNQMLIDIWNSVIQPEDVVFCLGDFSLTTNKAKLKNFISQLNGHKRFILGNHDRVKTSFYTESGCESASRYPVLYNDHIFLSHEPLPHHLVPEGYINFFGHVHGNLHFNWERGKCVSIEQLEGFRPVAIDEFIKPWHEHNPDRHQEK